MALIAALVQASVDQQYVMETFSSLFDLDLAVGDQLDKLGAWIGVSRDLAAALTITTYPTSTQLAVDTFTRANENPLNPADWSVLSAPTLPPLQIISDLCVPSVGAAECAEYYSGVSLPSDQYAEMTVPVVNTGEPPLIVFARANFIFNDFYFISVGSASVGSYETDLILVTGSAEIILGSYFGAIHPGDVLRLGCTGNLIFVQLNGVTIISVVDQTLASGLAGIDLGSSGADPRTAAISRFACGSYTPVVESITSLDDTQYRTLLKLFVAMNAWDGTIPGIYTIWNSVFAQEGFKILVQDDEDMTMVVVLLNPPTDLVILAILTQGYFLLRPAGVEIGGFYQPSLPISSVPIFGFDAENATVSGFNVGAWMVPVAA